MKDPIETITAIEWYWDVDKLALPDGTKIWNLVRVVLHSCATKKSIFADEKSHKLKKALLLLKGRQICHPADIVAFSDVDAQRNGYDPYVDPLKKIFPNYRIYDWPSQKTAKHTTLPGHIPLKIPFSVAMQKVLHRKPEITYNETLQKIVQLFEMEHDVSVARHVYDSIAIFEKIKRNMKWHLINMAPKCVIIRNGTGRFQMGIIQACKELNIPTIEVQHGLIYSQHTGYVKRMPSDNYDCVPDYIFTWGDTFSDIIKAGHLFKKENVISVGFPYLELKKELSVELSVTAFVSIWSRICAFARKYKKIVLVSGQEWGDVEGMLNSIAELNPDVGFIYKPHPLDPTTHSFCADNIHQVNKSDNIYSYFQVADYHLSAGSTTILESLFFGIPNILVPSKFANMKEFSIDGVVYISSPVEFADALKKVEGKRQDSLFKRHSLYNIQKAVNV